MSKAGLRALMAGNIRLNIPAPQLPEIAEPESLIGQIEISDSLAIVYLSPAKLVQSLAALLLQTPRLILLKTAVASSGR